MQTITLRTGQTSQPYQLGLGSIASVTQGGVGSWSAYFEYTYATAEAIRNNQATWFTWPLGTVSATTSDTCLYPLFARLNCVTGQVTGQWGDPNGSVAIPGLPWASVVAQATPTGALAGISIASSTFVNRPLPASAYPLAYLRFTDVGPGSPTTGGGNLFFSNGTRWKPVGAAILLDAIDTANSAVANTTEQNLNPNRTAIPAGLIGDGDRIRMRMTLSKNGAADTCTIRVRFGTAGTIADTLLTTVTTLATTNQTIGLLIDFKRASATTIQKLGNATTDTAYNGPNSGAYPAAVTVSNMDTNPMFFSVTTQMTGGTEVATLQDMTIEFAATDSN